MNVRLCLCLITKPLFPFGHGLSYTTFSYGKLSVDKKIISKDEVVTVSVKVKNTGTRSGKEVVQLYIRDNKSSFLRPEKELKAFEKVFLLPGEEKLVDFKIDKSSLSFFDNKKHEWIVEPGTFEAIVGSSSRDIKGKISFEVR